VSRNPEPSLILSRRDARRLQALLSTPEGAGSVTAAFLRAGIERADLREPEDIPPNVVTMNSSVSVLDEEIGRESIVRVVYPHAVSDSFTCVSVLAPLGAALLGLRTGDAVEWPMPDQQVARLRVTGVHYQPEAAGLPE